MIFPLDENEVSSEDLIHSEFENIEHNRSTNTDFKRYDLCIVGAGIAGCALAIKLGRMGYKIALIEKNWNEPNEIFGELLQPSGVRQLQDLNLSDVFDGYDCQKIFGYGIFLDGDHFNFSYRSGKKKSESRNGYSFRYGRFVQKLRSYLTEIPAVEKIEGTVSQTLEVKESRAVSGVVYRCNKLNKKFEIHAKLVALCNGAKSTGLKKKITKKQSKVYGCMLGLTLDFCNLPYPSHGHVILADPSPVLIYPIETKRTRILIDFPKEINLQKGEDVRRYLLEEIFPQLPGSLQKPFLKAVEKGEFRKQATISYRAEPEVRRGVVVLGDSLNQRHPLTGAGMTVALTDAKELGNALLKIRDFSDHNQTIEVVRKFYLTHKKLSNSINLLSIMLYQVCKNEQLRKGLFQYLSQGESYNREPMLMISCLSRDRTLLLKHVRNLAWFCLKKNFLSTPNIKNLINLTRLYIDGSKIIFPLLKEEVTGYYRN